LALDGSTNYVRGDAILNLPQRTLAVWVWLPALPGVAAYVAGFQNSPGDTVHDGILWIDGSGYLRWWILGSAFTPSTLKVPVRRWVMLAGTLDANNSESWINGINAGQVVAGSGGRANYTAPNLFIGGPTITGNGASVPAAMRIRRARVWDRGLTRVELLAEYSAGLAAYRPRAFIWVPDSAAAADLAATATAAATAAAELTAGITLAAAALSVATAAGTLTTEIPLSASALAVSTATGDLTAQITLAGEALAEASAGGVLTTQIRLEGAALAAATATASLTTDFNPIELAAAATAEASAIGTLTTNIALSAAAIAEAVANGSLTVEILLAANATATATASGTLTGGTAPRIYYRFTGRARRLATLTTRARRAATLTTRAAHV
jgi:hypothetical protein